jgi:RNA polymerase subunit RPABC4/transcription elongation factor Spt4
MCIQWLFGGGQYTRYLCEKCNASNNDNKWTPMVVITE